MIKNKFAAAYLETGTVAGLPNGHFINGTWAAGDSGQTMQSFDPALAEPFDEFALCPTLGQAPPDVPRSSRRSGERRRLCSRG